ncbi:MAG: dihydroorotase [Bacteroides sp.]|nr:dihydroorotase [Bacteroides sp.]
MKRIWIKGGTLVNEGETFRGSLVIEGEKIAEVLQEGEIPAAPCEEEINACGGYILPGVIDDHVHFRDPGLTYKADMHTESQAAVAGGVTSFMDMPNTDPQTTTLEALKDKFREAAGKSLINYSFYFGATNNNYELLPELEREKVCGVKLFMGSSTGNMLVDNRESLLRIFEKSNHIIAVHCENQYIIDENTAYLKNLYGENMPVAMHPRIRSVEACYESSKVAVELAKETGSRLHLLHITTGKELELLEDKPIGDKKITAEVCIPHLVFTSYDYEKYGARIKCNPAVKSAPNREALWQALPTDLIDVVATDHAPHLLSEKEGGALKAVSGMPMIQFSLLSMLELASRGISSLENVVEKMCHNPARLFGIRKKGFLRRGWDADVVIVSPNMGWELTAGDILSKCGWSPLEGETFHWKVNKTWVNGSLVYNEGAIDTAYRGQPLSFDR